MILLVYVGDSSRKAREAFLIQKSRTIYPDGLNIQCQLVLRISGNTNIVDKNTSQCSLFHAFS